MSVHLLTEDEAAAALSVRVETLRYWRRIKAGPTAVKMGRIYRYRESDLDAHIAKCRVQPGGAGKVVT